MSTALRQAALVVSGEAGRAAVAVEGRWDGTMEDPDLGKRLFTVQLRNDKRQARGLAHDVARLGRAALAAARDRLRRRQRALHGRLQGTAFRFKGTLENNTVTGNIERNGRAPVPFTLQFVE